MSFAPIDEFFRFDNSYNNSFQQKFKQDKAMIEKSDKVFISADKTTNLFKCQDN